MHLIEVKAKVKTGKENELNQVLKDLIPIINSINDLKIEVYNNEENGELSVKFLNGTNIEKTKVIMNSKYFNLFIGSIKVLCEWHSLIIPGNEEKTQNLNLNNWREPK